MKNRYLFLRLGNFLSRQRVPISGFCHKSASKFYLGLALLISAVMVMSVILGITFGGIEESTFDYSMKIRLSSPRPSAGIVILDIDEKSLAELAPRLGRWPWKREIMAQVLAELEAAGAKSVIFNILITDPDIGNEQSDAVLNEIAGETKAVVFPLVRLPAANDEKSQLHVSSLPGAQSLDGSDPTIAAILPFLAGMHKNLGIANLEGDEDGIIRRYSLIHREETWSMPTLVGRTITLAGNPSQVEEKKPLLLNWRNKRGSYRRVPFVDYLMTLEGDQRLEADLFRNRHVIIGASAPGISNARPTSSNPVTDDNEILATALDDALNGTNLTVIPAWAIMLLAILFIWSLAWLFLKGRSGDDLDKLFVAIEIGALALMFLAVSYSSCYIDMTPLATYGIAYFSVARLHQRMANRVVHGAPEQLGTIASKNPRWLGIVAFRNDKMDSSDFQKKFHELEKEFGFRKVFLCINAFVDDQLLDSLNDVGCVVAVDENPQQQHFLERLHSSFTRFGVPVFECRVFDFPDSAKRDQNCCSRFMSMKTLEVISQLPVC